MIFSQGFRKGAQNAISNISRRSALLPKCNPMRTSSIPSQQTISAIASRAYSASSIASSLDFVPIPDFEDPLDETARSALAKSCYLKIDWKISKDDSVFEAINRMVANKIGALAVCEADGTVCGVVSERDYLNKVGFLGRTSKDTKVSEICTHGAANLISVTLDNPIDKCMRKMLDRNVRHLLIREKDTGKIVGMISVKDIVKCALAKQDAVVDRLTEMVVMSEAMSKDV